jgi:hypothetical protein
MEATDEQNAVAPAPDPQTDAVEDPAAAAEERRQKRRSRWGAETEAGLKALGYSEDGSEQGTTAQPGDQEQGDGRDAGGEPATKRRRNRWEPGDTKVATLVPGLPPIVLPSSIAHLVDLNPESLELQRKLGAVGVPRLVGVGVGGAGKGPSLGASALAVATELWRVQHLARYGERGWSRGPSAT